MRNKILHGDSAEVLKGFGPETIDATVTDPPYGLGTKQPTAEDIASYLHDGSKLDHGGDFMGRDWDIPSVPLWREVYRVMKPGGILMVFAGTRTLDLMAAGIEAAGFKYAGCLAWTYGQGFPKSLNIGKAIDKMKGATREVLGTREGGFGNKPEDVTFSLGDWTPTGGNDISQVPITAPATPEAAKWEGWGTALKPAWEPVLVFSKGPTDWKMPMVPFLYNAKASRQENTVDGHVENNHPTKKPVDVMKWLARLTEVPREGLILDPFLGSGTTAAACADLRIGYVGIERDDHFFKISQERVGRIDAAEETDENNAELFEEMCS